MGYLIDIGPIQINGMGSDRISCSEILAWQEGVGITLQPWEFRFLRDLSGEYLQETHRAEDPDCPQPIATVTEVDRDTVSKKISQTMRAIMAAETNQ